MKIIIYLYININININILMHDSMTTPESLVCDNENNNKSDTLIRKYFKYGYYFILFSFVFSIIATILVKDNKND